MQLLEKNQTCQFCVFSDVCEKEGGQKSQGHKFKSQQVHQRGSSLFSMGDKFQAIYILRSGSAKTCLVSQDGEQQIASFHYTGDIVGLDGFDSDQHAHNLTFLETSSVCRIGLVEFNRAMAESVTVRQRLLKSMSHILVGEQQVLFTNSKYNAEQRLANFLLNLSAGFEQRGLSPLRFNLSMTRIDIANFLGLAFETVSRLLSKMQLQKTITVNHRQVSLLDLDKLRQTLVCDAGPKLGLNFSRHAA